MASTPYRSIEDITEVLQNAKLMKRRCALLVGAGCSVTAGIPSAAGFVEIIKNERHRAYERASPKTYPRCMGELLLSERRDLIARYVDKAKINWAHLCIALLMQAGYVDRVLTTNFDLLVARACAMLGVFPAIYDFASSQLLKKADIPDQAVFYLHGQRTGFVLMNTEEDLARHSKLLGPVFDDAGTGRVWIVVGYSGENDPVFDHLAAIPQFDYGLFWIGYGDQEPPSHVRQQLLTQGKDAFCTRGYDADSFFVSLTRSLEIFPPDLVARPFTYLQSTLSHITPFTDQMFEDDVIRTPRSWILSAIEQFETPPAWETIIRGGQSKMDVQKRAAMLSVTAQYLLMRGHYEEVLAFRNDFDESPSPEFANLLSIAYVMRGNQLLDRAKATTGNDADQFFTEAKQLYQEALKIRPDRSEALHGWGNLLLDLAKARTGEEADTLFAEADEKYEQAHKIRPNHHTILVNWANLLLERAKRKKGEEAEQFFIAAEEKYKSALDLKPDAAEIFLNWGNLLLDRAKTKTGDESVHFFEAAEEKYRSALAINPEYPGVLYQWGNVLLDRAKLSSGEESDRLFEAAEEKYRASLDIRPDRYDVLNSWGCLLMDQGKQKSGREADQRFMQARAKFEAALAIRPDLYEALKNWGNLLLDQAKTKTGAEADELFSRAAEKYEAALDIKPDMYDALDNWGNLLLDQAKTKTGDEAERLFEQGEKKFRDANAAKPDRYEALNNWGNLLSDWGRRKTTEEAEALFAEAERKYNAALAIKADAADVLHNRENLYRDWANTKTGPEAAQLLARAKNQFQ